MKRDVEVGSSSLLIPTIERLNIYLIDVWPFVFLAGFALRWS